jgi:hypothetical protein
MAAVVFLNKLGQRVLTRPRVAPTFRFLRGGQRDPERTDGFGAQGAGARPARGKMDT